MFDVLGVSKVVARYQVVEYLYQKVDLLVAFGLNENVYFGDVCIYILSFTALVLAVSLSTYHVLSFKGPWAISCG